jgi:acyl-coenzyme A synthetase/AMP-(fatty) acid ligase/3-hydroxymyristoyl/3-hydroxydecanoyl-(acyl carrier protein) dehydratase
LVQHGSAYWIASPAHLKRLDRYSPWDGISGLKAIFSSGGALPESAAQQIFSDGGQAVIEVYGSSETGGIAWRQQDQAWTLFAGMRLSCIDGTWYLHSPYLEIPPSPPFSKGGDERKSRVFIKDEFSPLLRKNPPFEKGGAGGGFQLDDQITLQDDGRFTLHGRLDRIVKIEEKRLSLVELEHRLASDPWVDEAHALVIAKGRDVVAAVIVLSQAGTEQLQSQGRNRLIKQFRKTLGQWFESVVLPRKWLFVNTMPLTSQGKIDRQLLTNLLDFDNRKLPQVLTLEMTPDSVRLGLRVPEDLLYFPDHFADYPILPGVVQLAWVEHFGRLFFVINKPFSHMEVVKFTQLIKPGDQLTLALDWKAGSGKLYFNFSSEHGTHSSGRMIYEGCV